MEQPTATPHDSLGNQSPDKRTFLRFSLRGLFELLAAASIWAGLVGLHLGHRGPPSLLDVFLGSLILGFVSYGVYRYWIPLRITPLLTSHFSALAFFLLYGGGWAGSFSEIFSSAAFIASGPFAYGWRLEAIVAPSVILPLSATTLGLLIRPGIIACHLLAVAAFYWYLIGFILAVFASLGT